MADVGTRAVPRLFDPTAKRGVDLRIELRRLCATLRRIANRMGQAFWPTLKFKLIHYLPLLYLLPNNRIAPDG